MARNPLDPELGGFERKKHPESFLLSKSYSGNEVGFLEVGSRLTNHSPHDPRTHEPQLKLASGSYPPFNTEHANGGNGKHVRAESGLQALEKKNNSSSSFEPADHEILISNICNR